MSADAWSDEMFSIISATERLRALATPLSTCSRAAVDVLDVAPDLAPEMDAVSARIGEAIEHVLAAQAVLKERLSLLGAQRA